VSLFADSSWVSDNRPAQVTGTVAPGDTFEFKFNLHAPPTAGTYQEYFGVVQDGVAWFSDPGQGGPPDDDLEANIEVTAGSTSCTADPGVPDGGSAGEDAGAKGGDAGKGAGGDAGVGVSVDSGGGSTGTNRGGGSGSANAGAGWGQDGGAAGAGDSGGHGGNGCSGGGGRTGEGTAVWTLLALTAVVARRRRLG
jgi:MYXO-CTERM domain-containing protein